MHISSLITIKQNNSMLKKMDFWQNFQVEAEKSAKINCTIFSQKYYPSSLEKP